MKQAVSAILTGLTALSFNLSQAAVITLDDFSAVQGTVVTTTALAPQSTVLGNRTIRVINTAPSPLANSFVNVAAVSGPNFAISNPSQTNSTIELIYTLGANAALTGAMPSFVFDVLSRDRESSVAISFDGALGSFSLLPSIIPPAPPAAIMLVAITPAQLNQLAGGGALKLTFAGIDDYDLTIDNLRVTVPVPASLALVGLGLLGFGLRRKS